MGRGFPPSVLGLRCEERILICCQNHLSNAVESVFDSTRYDSPSSRPSKTDMSNPVVYSFMR